MEMSLRPSNVTAGKATGERVQGLKAAFMRSNQLSFALNKPKRLIGQTFLDEL